MKKIGITTLKCGNYENYHNLNGKPTKLPLENTGTTTNLMETINFLENISIQFKFTGQSTKLHKIPWRIRENPQIFT